MLPANPWHLSVFTYISWIRVIVDWCPSAEQRHCCAGDLLYLPSHRPQPPRGTQPRCAEVVWYAKRPPASWPAGECSLSSGYEAVSPHTAFLPDLQLHLQFLEFTPATTGFHGSSEPASSQSPGHGSLWTSRHCCQMHGVTPVFPYGELSPGAQKLLPFGLCQLCPTPTLLLSSQCTWRGFMCLKSQWRYLESQFLHTNAPQPRTLSTA